MNLKLLRHRRFRELRTVVDILDEDTRGWSGYIIARPRVITWDDTSVHVEYENTNDGVKYFFPYKGWEVVLEGVRNDKSRK